MALTHRPDAVAVEYPGEAPRWRPVCGCGWSSKAKVYDLPKTREIAVEKAQQHAGDKGCGLKRFDSKRDAQQAVLDAKIARGIKGATRRQEERAFCCPVCPGAVWHLTRKPEKESA